MLDQQHGHVGRQFADGGKELLTLGIRHAGRRLVEQQHVRPAGEGERDLEQALLAVRQDRRALVHDVGQAEPFEDLDDLIGHRRSAADQPPPIAAVPEPFGDRKTDVSSGVRSPNSWLIWKVRAMPRRTR